MSSSLEEDQSSAPRDKSSGPSRKANSDQDRPKNDPDSLCIANLPCVTFPLSMQKRWRPIGLCSCSLTPGILCLGLPLQLWGLMTRKVNRSSGVEALPLSYPLTELSKTPLINLAMIFRPQIYLRVNTSKILLPVPCGTRWDSLVMKTRSRS